MPRSNQTLLDARGITFIIDCLREGRSGGYWTNVAPPKRDDPSVLHEGQIVGIQKSRRHGDE